MLHYTSGLYAASFTGVQQVLAYIPQDIQCYKFCDTVLDFSRNRLSGGK